MSATALNQTFYEAIPPIHSITEITNPEHYYDVPADWHIALTDVQGSTKAIEAGRYKDVNAVAAASITALLNNVPGMDIPFVFGGDGATILIPPSVMEQAKTSLIATRRLAASQFGLTLRIGIVPVHDVLMDGYRIRVARLRMSDNFQQAIFSGGGLAQADRLLKHPENGEKYRIVDDGGNYVADFSGFECRWNAIPSTYEETLSLMVMALPNEQVDANTIYKDVLRKIEELYGDAKMRHPIAVENLHMALNPYKLTVEARVRHQDTSLPRLLKMLKGSFKAWVAMKLHIRNWGGYKQILVAATDHEKFDDTLRMTISGTIAQREALRAYLEEKHQQNLLVYGTHMAKHTLMTCIVFDYFGRQVHFVDAADGGYAIAAKEMKAQLAK